MRLLFALVLAVPGFALAHGGAKDAVGCHTDSRTGAYHCHGATPRTVRAPKAPRPPKPPKMTYAPKGSRGLR